MIFEEVTRAETPKEKRTREQWIDIGVAYLSAKKKYPGLTAKKFAEDNGLKYETFKRSMTRFKDDIKKYYSSTNPNKNKAQWIELGMTWLDERETGMTGKQFADKYGLNYETASRAFRKYAKEITMAREIRDAKKTKKKLNARQKYEELKKDFRSQIRLKTRDSVAKNQKKSQEWFNQTMKQNIRSHKVSKPLIGRLYAFIYDAKHKDTLPYWDVYPLIVYLGMSTRHKGLMLGLNLHYVPPKARVEFMEELLKYTTTDGITNKTSLKINWGKVKNMKGADAMIKSYIPGRIKGSFAEIKPAEWHNAVMLPTSKFVSGPESKPVSLSTVWKK